MPEASHSAAAMPLLSANLADVAELWRRGSVVRSWLLDLTARALHADPGLEGFGGHVADSGEGRWTLQAGIDAGVPLPVPGVPDELDDEDDELSSPMKRK